MIDPDFSYKVFNNNILHLEWTPAIDIDQIKRIKQFALNLKDKPVFQLLDIVPAYHSLTLFFKDKIDEQSGIVETLRNFYHATSLNHSESGKTWKIPVVYGGSSGPDFSAVCNYLKMEAEQFIQKHCTPLYEVHFIGFLPGFPYLGGLSSELFMPRKDAPSNCIPSGSVGIGGSQTGIYPVNSPGGWNIIGYTPFPLFDVNREPPIVIRDVDTIQFYPIHESALESCKLELIAEIEQKQFT